MADNSSYSNGSSILPSVLGVSAVILLFVLIVYVAAWVSGGSEEVAEASGDQPPTAAELRAQEHETLTTYGWVDQEKGTVRIPLERATELVIEELNQ